MGFRFRKRIKVAPGLTFNFGKRGVSTTIGKLGASVNIGPQGSHLNVGLHGTGVSFREKIGGGSQAQSIQKEHKQLSPGNSIWNVGLFLGFIPGYWASVSFLNEYLWTTLAGIVGLVPGLIAGGIGWFLWEIAKNKINKNTIDIEKYDDCDFILLDGEKAGVWIKKMPEIWLAEARGVHGLRNL